MSEFEIKETKEIKEVNIVALCDGTLNSPYVKTNVYKLYLLLRDLDKKENEESKRTFGKIFKCGKTEVGQNETEEEHKTKEEQGPKIGKLWSRKLKCQSDDFLDEFPPHAGLRYGDYYYEAGVGGRINIIDASVAEELDSKVKNAYRHIVQRYNHHYNSKHEKAPIWLFGFSRGAYTARSVAGMINNCGILKYDSVELIDRAYELYRSKDPVNGPKGPESKKFRDSFSHPLKDVKIKFLGLWDTVGAEGIPTFTIGRGFEYLKLNDLNVSKIVKNAYQALSIHERLTVLEPCRLFIKYQLCEGEECIACKECGICKECRICNECKDSRECRYRNSNEKECEECEECKNDKKCKKTKTKIEEKWFPGGHLEVGGGLYSIDQRINNSSLLWMIEKIISTGGLLEGKTLGDVKNSLKEINKLSIIQKTIALTASVPFFILKRAIDSLVYMHRDRIITLYRNSDGKITLESLYKEGNWDEFESNKSNKLKLKILNSGKHNSLTKYYKAIEEILIEELKGGGEIAGSDTKDEGGIVDKINGIGQDIEKIRHNIGKKFAQMMDKNTEDSKEKNDDTISTEDTKEKEMDDDTISEIYRLFDGKIDEANIKNIKSFSALTISKLDAKNIESIKKKWKIIKEEMENNKKRNEK